jgi:hypothetical protein
MSGNVAQLLEKARAEVQAMRLKIEKETKDAFFANLLEAGKSWKDPAVYSGWLKVNSEPEFTSDELAVSSDVNVLLENRRLILQSKLDTAGVAVAAARLAEQRAESAPYEAAYRSGDPIVYNLENYQELRATHEAAENVLHTARMEEFGLKKRLKKHTYLLPPSSE